MVSTEAATEGLFRLLDQYARHKFRAIAELINAKNKTLVHLESQKASYSSVDTAREVISGSILQIAYVGIKKYTKPKCKSNGALHFESEINRLIHENPKARQKKRFELPEEFCVGRELGNLPIGMVIYAARNQYNHFYDKRLSVVNELIFNYLNTLWPNPRNDLSFNLYDENQYYYCYSCLAALGWTDSEKQSAYEKYKTDLSDILDIKF